MVPHDEVERSVAATAGVDRVYQLRLAIAALDMTSGALTEAGKLEVAVLVFPKLDVGVDADLFQSFAPEELVVSGPAVVPSAPAKKHSEFMSQAIGPVRAFYGAARGNTESSRVALQIVEAGSHWCGATIKVGLVA